MYWIGYVLALLATIVVGWALPLIGVAIALPLLQVLYNLNPWVAVILMVMLGGLIVYYSLTHQAYWQAIAWAALWGLGAVAAVAGAFHWYALLVEVLVLVVLLVPGLVVPGWAGLLRWYAAGEIGLTLLLIWGEGQGLPGTVLVIALLLLALAALIGLGAYRPFEARRLRRMAATLATLAAIALLIWQPVLQPAAGWLGEVLVTSPIGRWYHVWALRAERTELGERAKTEALRQLQGPLTDAHRQRWERGIQQVPNLHLTEEEWRDLGVPREADP